MVCSSYAEVTAAIDSAYVVPKRPMRWRGILASLADGLVRGVHPLQEMAEMEHELHVFSHRRPDADASPSVTPTPG